MHFKGYAVYQRSTSAKSFA